jgi:hypothetical protein
MGLMYKVDGKIEKNEKYKTSQTDLCLDSLGGWDEYFSVF